MRPRVTLHMMSSIDGRITSAGWPDLPDAGEIYEELHRELRGDAWLVGRVTMDEFAKGEPRPASAEEAYPRQTCKATGTGLGPFAVYLDGAGRVHLNIGRANGDAVIAVLTTSVSDSHLAELRRDGISYIFAGEQEIDLASALATLRAEFGIETLLLEGGGGINGAFLHSDLIDEISLLILPIADGKPNTPTLFDHNPGSGRALRLDGVESMAGGLVRLRYTVAT